jgi:hypothetical protein
MRKLLGYFAGCLLVGTCLFAGELSWVPYGTITAATNATVQGATTNADYLHGFVRAVDIDLAGTASGTTRVDVVTDASLGPARERTVLSVTSLKADGFYTPELNIDTTAGADSTDAFVPFPLCGERLVVRAYNANLTGVTVNVDILIEADK